MAALSEQATKLLDFSQKLDINLLDNIVGVMYTGNGDQVGTNSVLVHLDNFWLICLILTLLFYVFPFSNELHKKS